MGLLSKWLHDHKFILQGERLAKVPTGRKREGIPVQDVLLAPVRLCACGAAEARLRDKWLKCELAQPPVPAASASRRIPPSA